MIRGRGLTTCIRHRANGVVATACLPLTGAARRWAASTGGGGSDSQQQQPPTPAPASSSSPAAESATEKPSADVPDVDRRGPSSVAKKEYKLGEIDPELRSPRRATGLFSVKDLEDKQSGTIGFGRIDEVESTAVELERRSTPESNALLSLSDEERWQHKLQFVHNVVRTPKHLTWEEYGKEVECLDCIIDLDDHRPEEILSLTFQFRDKRSGSRDTLWTARHDAAKSSAFADFLAAIGACLGRADVYRTIRFDDGLGKHREITIQKNSRYTSEIKLSFRPEVEYDLYATTEATLEWEDAMNKMEVGGWGFHPDMARDPDYHDLDDPVGTYHLVISAHALAVVTLQALNRLIERPLEDFYRPSQLAKTVRRKEKEELGVAHAIRGFLGTEEQRFQHMTPLDALEDHFFGADAPFTLAAIMMRLREMAAVKQENPEFRSWLATRRHDSQKAARNVKLKLLGTGASTLFTPLGHNATVGRMLPKEQQRNIKASVSVAGVIGMPDETRRLSELQQIAESGKMLTEEGGERPKDATAKPGASQGSASGEAPSSSETK